MQLPGPGQYDYDMFNIARRTSRQSFPKAAAVSAPDDGMQSLKVRISPSLELYS